MENTSEDDQVLNPEWEIGTAEIVEEEPDLPRTETEDIGLPAVPEDLSPKKEKRKKKRTRGLTCGLSRHVRWDGAHTRKHSSDRTLDPY